MLMKTVFFDLETQYLFRDLGMMDYKSREPGRLKLAVAGVLSDNEYLFFHEDRVQELFKILNQADLIVGHNLLRFDYLVLQPYFRQNIPAMLQHKTFDMMRELEKLTGCWISLNDLGQRNLGVSKTVDVLKIPKMWRAGRHQEVKDYLAHDLEMTAGIFNHGKKIKRFRYERKEYGESLGEREVSVEW